MSLKKQLLTQITVTAFFFLLYMPVFSQVTIGSGEKPVPGALLDLKQKGTTTKGLALPRVMLTETDNLYPMFEGVQDYEDGTIKTTEDKKHSGLVVYNMANTGPICPGIYLWDGSQWNRIFNDKCYFLHATPLSLNFPATLATIQNISLKSNIRWTPVVNPADLAADKIAYITPAANTEQAAADPGATLAVNLADNGIDQPTREFTISITGTTPESGQTITKDITLSQAAGPASFLDIETVKNALAAEGDPVTFREARFDLKSNLEWRISSPSFANGELTGVNASLTIPNPAQPTVAKWIYIDASPNTIDAPPRSFNINFSAVGPTGITHNISKTITQEKGVESYFNITPSTLSVAQTGGTASFSATANIPWKTNIASANIAPGKITTLNPSNVNTTNQAATTTAKTVGITVAANGIDQAARTLTIPFVVTGPHGANRNKSVTVTQPAGPASYIRVDNSTGPVVKSAVATGGTVNFSVASNIPWYLANYDNTTNWNMANSIAPVTGSATAGTNISINVKANPVGCGTRETTIMSVTPNGYTTTPPTIKVTQIGQAINLTPSNVTVNGKGEVFSIPIATNIRFQKTAQTGTWTSTGATGWHNATNSNTSMNFSNLKLPAYSTADPSAGNKTFTMTFLGLNGSCPSGQTASSTSKTATITQTPCITKHTGYAYAEWETTGATLCPKHTPRSMVITMTYTHNYDPGTNYQWIDWVPTEGLVRCAVDRNKTGNKFTVKLTCSTPTENPCAGFPASKTSYRLGQIVKVGDKCGNFYERGGDFYIYIPIHGQTSNASKSY